MAQAKESISSLEKEYAEFEKGSRELEEHLEGEVSRMEDELEAANKKLRIAKSELQDAKEKQIETEREKESRIQSLEQELEEEKAKSAKLASRLVALEQENEDLERVHRELQADFGKSQTTMDSALEENAVIQTDLEELRNLSRETVQRMTDELRGTKIFLFCLTLYRSWYPNSLSTPSFNIKLTFCPDICNLKTCLKSSWRKMRAFNVSLRKSLPLHLALPSSPHLMRPSKSLSLW